MTTTGTDLTIRKELMLDCSREHAFAVFTDGIGAAAPESHEGYDSGWNLVLGRYAGVV